MWLHEEATDVRLLPFIKEDEQAEVVVHTVISMRRKLRRHSIEGPRPLWAA